MSLISEADRRAIAAAEDTTEGEPATEDEVVLAREYAGYLVLSYHLLTLIGDIFLQARS